jgi:hypothetical protein
MSPLTNNVQACVIDTETTFINRRPRLVYHFGATFGNIEQKNSFSFGKMDYYVKEVMQDIELFLKQNKQGDNFGFNKSMAKAHKDAYNNFHKVRRWKDIVEEFNEQMKSRNIEYLTAYNYNFDIGVSSDKGGVIRHTQKQLRQKTFYIPQGVKSFCLQDICATLVMNKNYFKWIKSLDDYDKNQMTTINDNFSYSAECVQRYLSKDLHYHEEHTAYRDSTLEMGLLMYAWDKWKNIIKRDFVDNIQTPHWTYIAKGLSAKKKLELRKGKPVRKPIIQTELNLQGGK